MNSRHFSRSALLHHGLKFQRNADEAFRTAQYAIPFEGHIPPTFWHRVSLFLRRRFFA